MWNQNDPFIQSHTHSNFMILEVTKTFPNGPNNKPDLQGRMWFVENICKENSGEGRKGNGCSLPFHF